jgi:hypothetical protein
MTDLICALDNGEDSVSGRVSRERHSSRRDSRPGCPAATFCVAAANFATLTSELHCRPTADSRCSRVSLNGSVARPGEPGRLRFISSNLAGRSLARIVKEKLVAVGIVDNQKPVAPRTILDRNAFGLEFCAQRV